MNLGAHMSIAGGVHLALERGLSIGCNAVQLFVKSSNQWRARPLAGEETGVFRELRLRFDPRFILAHGSYLINLASPDPVLLAKSRRSFIEEMRHCDILGIPYLVLHPGSHRGSGEETGIRTIAESLNLALYQREGSDLTILLETTAGQGNSVGSTFEQLAAIIELVDLDDRVGICFDTCHAFAAGYDLRTKRAYTGTFHDFDRIIGLERLRAFHLNDSLKGLGSHLDRHTHIGAGRLGRTAFSLLVNDPAFRDRPMVLETPKGPDLEEDIENLKLLRRLRKGRPKRRGTRRRG
ncbi:MAG TPA: deoxyribonuclease IV [Patescibacteria group bacterium]|nr:deoxyribonuclease IV [Patescibacteria group bacterium]